MIDSNLTVDGRLIVSDFAFVASTDDTKEIVVNGFLMAETAAGPDTKDKWFTPVAVSYYQTMENSDGDDTEYWILTSISNIQHAIDASDDKEIAIEGKAKLGDISINGGSGEMAEVTFKKEVNAGTITINNVKLIFEKGKKINATFADANGSIVIRGGYAGKDMEIFNEGSGVYLSGEITDDEDATYSISFFGTTGMEDATISWGHYIPDAGQENVYPTITFAGETLATGKKNEIKPINEEYGYDVVSVVSKLSSAGSSRLVIDADVEVLGILAADEKSTSSTAGVIDVNGDLFVGTTIAAIYNADDVVSAGSTYDEPIGYGLGPQVTGAAAIVSGKVNIEGYVTVLANSTIAESIVEDFDSFDAFVDGSLWLTIYRGDAAKATFNLLGMKAPVVNGKVTKIVNQDDVTLGSYDNDYNVVVECEKPVIFGTDDAVYFEVMYDVFTINIKTDASIKTVYLDGILMKTGQQMNQFFLENQTAGKHTISVEPMTGYTAANAYLYDDNGVALPGLTFSFDREDCVVDVDTGNYTFDIWYNVAGTELVEPAIAVAGWDITTILLLVLVILIAIMAVIVALRLNRN